MAQTAVVVAALLIIAAIFVGGIIGSVRWHREAQEKQYQFYLEVGDPRGAATVAFSAMRDAEMEQDKQRYLKWRERYESNEARK